MNLRAASVVLRPVRPDDHEVLIAILSDAETMKWALKDRPFSRSDARDFIDGEFAGGDETFGMHVIGIDPDGDPIGFCALRECNLLGESDVEFGWVLSKEYQGRGYATALGRALIDVGLNSLRFRRVLAACHPANATSEHILRDKLGMRFEREVEPRPSFRRRVYSATAD